MPIAYGEHQGMGGVGPGPPVGYAMDAPVVVHGDVEPGMGMHGVPNGFGPGPVGGPPPDVGMDSPFMVGDMSALVEDGDLENPVVIGSLEARGTPPPRPLSGRSLVSGIHVGHDKRFESLA
jgi:hypothetical protein